MKQSKNILILIVTSLLLCACPVDKYPDGHKYITIINKSDINIGFQTKWDDDFFCDTSRPEGSPYVFVIPKDSLYNHYITDKNILQPWEKYLDKDQTLIIPVVNEKVFYQYWTQPCDTIRKYVHVLHTYRLTIADLQRMNWTVVYPPEK